MEVEADEVIIPALEVELEVDAKEDLVYHSRWTRALSPHMSLHRYRRRGSASSASNRATGLEKTTRLVKRQRR